MVIVETAATTEATMAVAMGTAMAAAKQQTIK
jgi:hypothetical protein